mmetsp:Transcript_3274/g.10932  ORF Transcript_3274/g.10932 Transcript_3274/m.10932 type:complete len:260 (-) Transcript_3274:1927-2706(-)
MPYLATSWRVETNKSSRKAPSELRPRTSRSRMPFKIAMHCHLRCCQHWVATLSSPATSSGSSPPSSARKVAKRAANSRLSRPQASMSAEIDCPSRQRARSPCASATLVETECRTCASAKKSLATARRLASSSSDQLPAPAPATSGTAVGPGGASVARKPPPLGGGCHTDGEADGDVAGTWAACAPEVGKAPSLEGGCQTLPIDQGCCESLPAASSAPRRGRFVGKLESAWQLISMSSTAACWSRRAACSMPCTPPEAGC